ncbi:hypothetical protein BGZ73_000379, partial [Actinomortierella ambigua]
MDLAENGDLTGVIKRQTLDWKAKSRIAHEIARGLEYIHDLGIVHSDLKSGNVLLTKYMEVKLCDFGFAQVRSLSMSKTGGGIKGTIRWMAPELFTVRPKYSAKSDIYALGMVMWEMAADCTKPFKDNANNATVAMLVVRGQREIIPENTPDKYREVVEQCWDQDPGNRPTASEVILYEHGAEDPSAVEGQDTSGQSDVPRDASGNEPSVVSVTTIIGTMSTLPSFSTSIQKPSESEGNASRDVHALLERANADDVEAQIALAVMYENGTGVEKDDSESFKWYLRAAELGSVESQFKIGRYFEDGQGTDKNEPMAAH